MLVHIGSRKHSFELSLYVYSDYLSVNLGTRNEFDVLAEVTVNITVGWDVTT